MLVTEHGLGIPGGSCIKSPVMTSWIPPNGTRGLRIIRATYSILSNNGPSIIETASHKQRQANKWHSRRQCIEMSNPPARLQSDMHILSSIIKTLTSIHRLVALLLLKTVEKTSSLVPFPSPMPENE
ncbi:hypothetical protein BC831DRAFT_100932 [Entophlyctis helioformis]|nr:hypothetical protein BC831DRAFT_100932 [Entophlyctis helioformis]